ncbi:RanGTP-binding protein-domain-containing protein [Lipomyces oligophaga]|uniref:RanGTP-binding protein-domain-containing protein n=1 Tax=Lipomyces oligophaga TaxID=45792 RepID=UPI0034CED0BE
MEQLLARAGMVAQNQAVSFVFRSGISLMSAYAFKGVSKFLEKLPDVEKQKLDRLRKKLKTRINIITPSIDLIQLLNARGYTVLQSTVSLTKELRSAISEFDDKVAAANAQMAAARSNSEKTRAFHQMEEYMTSLLQRIEESVQLLQLAITTSGANVTAALPDMISPGRLLQASAFLLAADAEFSSRSNCRVKVGPTFTLKEYTVFASTARNPYATTAGDITWKEEHAKCYVELYRVPVTRLKETSPRMVTRAMDRAEYLAQKVTYAYELEVIEELDDGRYHDEVYEGNGVERNERGWKVGRRRQIPLSIVTRLFFSASGRLLDIEEAVSPVLVVKLNKAFLHRSPYFMFEDDEESEEEIEEGSRQNDLSDNENERRAVSGRIDHPGNAEWLAFELWTEEDQESSSSPSSSGDEDETDSDWESEEEGAQESGKVRRQSGLGVSEGALVSAFSRLSLSSADIENLMWRRREAYKNERAKNSTDSDNEELQEDTEGVGLAGGTNSLSLLEYLIRLAALQANDQSGILSIADERISLYLRDDNKNGAGGAGTGEGGNGSGGAIIGEEGRIMSRDLNDPIGSPSQILGGDISPAGRARLRRRSGTPSSSGGSSRSNRGGQRNSKSLLSTTLGGPGGSNIVGGAGGGVGSRGGNIPKERLRGQGGPGLGPSMTPLRTPRQREGNDSTQLTPWELDRVVRTENVTGIAEGSPLAGRKTIVRRRGQGGGGERVGR